MVGIDVLAGLREKPSKRPDLIFGNKLVSNKPASPFADKAHTFAPLVRQEPDKPPPSRVAQSLHRAKVDKDDALDFGDDTMRVNRPPRIEKLRNKQVSKSHKGPQEVNSKQNRSRSEDADSEATTDSLKGKDEEASTSRLSPTAMEDQDVKPNIDDDLTLPVRRADDLTVIEELHMGPYPYKGDHSGSDEWRWREPNSGINLKERIMSHDQVQANLAERYFLSPSDIYSIMRVSPDQQSYYLPLDAPWAVLGVVCYKGEIKLSNRVKRDYSSKTNQGANEDSDSNDDGGLSDPASKKQKRLNGGYFAKKQQPSRPAEVKKFITLKICSLPSRSHMFKSSGGDAVLTLLLFEADQEETMPGNEPGEPPRKTYKGGSGGAFEKWNKLSMGAVVGIINPRILKPYGVSLCDAA